MKISILLPYKENFASNHAGAISLTNNDTAPASLAAKFSLYGSKIDIFIFFFIIMIFNIFSNFSILL